MTETGGSSGRRTAVPASCVALLAFSSLLVAACIGDGVAPESIAFESASPAAVATPFGFIPTEIQRQDAIQRFEDNNVFTAVECIPAGPATTGLIMRFSNGRSENITGRTVNYSSSNADIAYISNGDDGFQRGTVVPVAPGTASVTAEFVGFTAEMDIRVFPLNNVEAFIDFPEIIAPNSTAEVRITGRFQGQTIGASSAAEVTVVNANAGDDDDNEPVYSRVERPSGLAFVRGIVPESPVQVATARFLECDKGEFSQEFRVESPQELRVEREFDAEQWLPVGFTEVLKATAVFHGGAEQDVTGSVNFREIGRDEDDPALLFFPGGEIGNRVALGLVGLPSGDDDNDNGEFRNGGVTALSAQLSQFSEGVCNSIDEARRPQLPQGFADCDADALEDTLPAVDGNDVAVEVRRGRAVESFFAWDTGALDADLVDDDGTLLLPRGCSVQPDVIADIELLAENGNPVVQRRRINRETLFFVGPEPPDEEEEEEENGNGDGNGNGNGEEEEEEEAPVLQVVQREGIGTQLNAGLITAIGALGKEDIVRARRISPVDLQDPPDDDDDEDEDPETITLEDVLDVRIVEGVDCATLR